MYTQNNEELFITAYFGSNTGRLLDIGAYDGVQLSNSRKLIENGWSAVLVEPSPVVFTKLLENTKDLQHLVQLWNVALVPGKGLPMTWSDSMGDAISTVSETHLVKWAGHQNWRKFIVNPLSIHQFCEIVGHSFEYITIDVEGINYELLMEMPYGMLAYCQMLIIEYDNRQKDITDYLIGFGFKVHHVNAENLIFVK
jgi:FkbM family methyltransferase